MTKISTRTATKFVIRSVVTAALLGAATVAQAAFVPVTPTTTTNYTITGDNFTGTFSLAVSGDDYVLSAFSATYLGYQFDLTNTGIRQSGSLINLGGIVGGISGLTSYTNDFVTGYFVPTNTAQTFYGFSATLKSESVSNAFTIAPSANSGAVPEPAIWAMMIAGFGGIGLAMRRRAGVTKVAIA